jgi:hypothetical protein
VVPPSGMRLIKLRYEFLYFLAKSRIRLVQVVEVFAVFILGDPV